MEHKEDQGEAFGKWPNKTAQLMYHDIMPLALCGIDTSGHVADYGGANGLLKEFIPHAISVDYDASKKPDILDNIFSHVGSYDLIVMRYVLHYISDDSARYLFEHLWNTHKGRILIIQFVNSDLRAKAYNSVGEKKFFRSEAKLSDVLCEGWRIVSRKAVDYEVDADFYRWRLNHPNPRAHDERIVIWELAAR